MSLRDDIADIVEKMYWSTPDHRDSQSYIVANRILALLNKRCEEAGWIKQQFTERGHYEGFIDRPASIEEVIEEGGERECTRTRKI